MQSNNLKSILNVESTLSPEARALAATARKWGKSHIEPLIPKHWEEGTFPPRLLQSFRDQCPSLIGYSIPQEYGGKGYDLTTCSAISCAIASIDASIVTVLLVQYGLAAESILLCGNESQKRKFLPNLANLSQMGCFCLTEPQSGSDASDLRTTAHKIERMNSVTGKVETGYKISGSKRWIGNALTSEIFIVWAKNLSMPNHPVMGFIVQRSQQYSAHSIITNKIERKASMRMLQNADVVFDDAWCPIENVMSEYVGFSSCVGRVLESSRIGAAWVPVGICMGALEHTTEYVKKRKAFKAPLGSNQLIQEKLVRMAAMTTSMFLLQEFVTRNFALGKCSLPAIAMAKAHNSRAGREVVALGRELLGGNGIVLDYLIASKFCDMESAYTYEGTYDINMLIAGRALTGEAAIKSGAAVKGSLRKKEAAKPRSKL